MHLSAYMQRHDIDDEAFAGMIGVKRETVSRLRRGKIRPSLKTIEAIRAATSGAVTANDFLSDVVALAVCGPQEDAAA